MDKSAIRNFAIEARKILMKSAVTEAGFYGITKDECKSPIQKGSDFEVYETLAGTENRIFGDDIKRRANLVAAVKKQGFEQVIEETAYTWFNRIIAIRFMEVNNYLPSRVRVLSSESGSGTPDVVTQADTVELNLTNDELDKIQQAKNENKYDEAFRLLFIKQCNELNEILPGLFEKTDDYMELLLKLPYTSDGVVRMLIDTIPEDNFNVETEGQIEIIGWMYQYYNTELKDDTFSKLKKNVKIAKERIPAATQLFTPDWIVRYMVENSLGRVWINHLKSVDSEISESEKAKEFGWNYYLPESTQENDVETILEEHRSDYKDLKITDLTCIDPCMGSGHVLVYVFDVLMDIYKSEGYSEREAVFDILEYNIKGLDIDRRAYQLAYFALMMKARGYNRIFFRGREGLDGNRVHVVPKVYAVEESNSVNRDQLKYFGSNLSDIEKNAAINEISGVLDQLLDAKEYGSILRIDKYDWDLLDKFVSHFGFSGQMEFGMVGIELTQRLLKHLLNVAKILSNQYLAVITNPPYMGLSNGDAKLNTYVKKYYADEKADMFAVFISRCMNFTNKLGYQAMITQHSWMFLSSFEKLRAKMLSRTFINMAHLGPRAFEEIGGEVVQTTSFVIGAKRIPDYVATYARLVDYSSQKAKENAFLAKEKLVECKQEVFDLMPAQIISYWIQPELIEAFKQGSGVGEIGNPKQGIIPGNVNEFLRLWYEVDVRKIGFNHTDYTEISQKHFKWFPYNKGGAYRKWYGNYEFLINMENDGYDIKYSGKNNNYRLREPELYFKEAMTWSKIGTGAFSARYMPTGYLFDIAGCCVFGLNNLTKYVIGFANSKVCQMILNIISPTLNFEVEHIKTLPVIESKNDYEEITRIVDRNIEISKMDWDDRETSWDFKRSPLLGYSSVEEAVTSYINTTRERFEELKSNEEKLNEIFARIYNLDGKIDCSVSDAEVSVEIAKPENEIRKLISYAIGCIFGRYSIDEDGIVFAGGEFSKEAYKSFAPDEDNIIPITDESYFDDDIVTLFINWLEVAFGKESLNANLEYIASTLGNSSNVNPKVVVRNYFKNEFYKDHCAMYSSSSAGKRPIYWMFESGKQDAFKCLVYMHRYCQDTVGLIRSDYLIKTQAAIENALKNAEFIISTSSSATDKAQATNRRDKYIKQLSEMKYYYQALSHIALQRVDIDLDEGTKTNYAKFQSVEVLSENEKKQTIDLLAKI